LPIVDLNSRRRVNSDVIRMRESNDVPHIIDVLSQT